MTVMDALLPEPSRRPQFTVLTGDPPFDKRAGNTFYDVIGDFFGWLCLALGICALAWSLVDRGSAERRV